MSTLIKCKTCGKEMSRSADKCPHCGEKNENKNPIWQAIVGIVALLFLLSNNSLYIGNGKVALLFKSDTGFHNIFVTDETFQASQFKWVVVRIGTDGVQFFEDIDREGYRFYRNGR